MVSKKATQQVAHQEHAARQEVVHQRRDESGEKQHDRRQQRTLEKEHQQPAHNLRVERTQRHPRGNQEHDAHHQVHKRQRAHRAEKLAQHELVALHGLGEYRVDGAPLNLGGNHARTHDDGDEGSRELNHAEAEADNQRACAAPRRERLERGANQDNQQRDQQNHHQDALAHCLAEGRPCDCEGRVHAFLPP
jgi:hypothetical protein